MKWIVRGIYLDVSASSAFPPLIRPFRSSDSIFDPKTLRVVKRDSPSREIGKRFKAATFPTPIRRRLRRTTIEQRYIIGRWIYEGGRRRPVAEAYNSEGGWSMVMFPCRKLHYFIHGGATSGLAQTPCAEARPISICKTSLWRRTKSGSRGSAVVALGSVATVDS